MGIFNKSKTKKEDECSTNSKKKIHKVADEILEKTPKRLDNLARKMKEIEDKLDKMIEDSKS